MKAVKLTGPGTLELHDVPVPEPAADEVLIRVGGAGLCHSDLSVVGYGDKWHTFNMTMGHEGAGWVEQLGSDVRSFAVGDAVAVHLIWSCGTCRACAEGRDNACRVSTANRLSAPVSPGLGPDGAMADYQLVNVRYLVPTGDLSPVHAAPLTDAGLTPMHAINSARERLTPGSKVLVIGLGGLGHLGLQILRATTACEVIAIDQDPAKIENASQFGAEHALLSSADSAASIFDIAGEYGVDAVFDFVGAQPTLDLAMSVIAPDGMLRVVGIGGGVLGFEAGAGIQPWGVDVRKGYGGTRSDLLEVVALAQSGAIGAEVSEYSLADFRQAFDDLDAGRVPARAVLVPNP